MRSSRKSKYCGVLSLLGPPTNPYIIYRSEMHTMKVPGASSGENSLLQDLDGVPKEEKYPAVRFWDKETWLKALKALTNQTDTHLGKPAGKTGSGDSAKWLFLEGPDGNLLPDARRKSMRQCAYDCFTDISAIRPACSRPWVKCLWSR